MPQDPPATPVDDVVATGQRRSNPNDGWPERFFVEVIIPPEGQHAEIGELEEVTIDKCSIPAGRREWNADAAAAEALQKIFIKAVVLDGPNGFYMREWGAQLFEMPDGSVRVGEVVHGDLMTSATGGSVPLDTAQGVAGGVLIGEIHTHPSPMVTLSQPDRDRMNIAATQEGRVQRSYLAENSPNGIVMKVWKSSDSAAEQLGPGKEVNQEATKCPTS